MDSIIYEVRERIRSEFREFNIKCLFYISEIVLKIDEYDIFLTYLSKYLVEHSGYASDEDEAFEGDDVFDEELEKEADDYQENILILLEQKVGGRKRG